MVNYLRILCFGLMACFTLSCEEIDFNNGPIVSEERQVEKFTKINMDDAIDVVLIKGNKQKIEVSDRRDLLNDLSVKVENSIMYITSRKGDWLNNSDAKVTITIPDTLTEVFLDGAGDLVFKSEFTQCTSMSSHGSGCITSNAFTAYTDLAVMNTGSGDVSLNGTAHNLVLSNSGSADLELISLTSKNVLVNSKGSGDIVLDVEDNLDVTLSGSGDVSYKGNPKVTSNVSGSGKLKRK